jgi:hypothetical protein
METYGQCRFRITTTLARTRCLCKCGQEMSAAAVDPRIFRGLERIVFCCNCGTAPDMDGSVLV